MERIAKRLIDEAYNFHGGQGCPIYAMCSSAVDDPDCPETHVRQINFTVRKGIERLEALDFGEGYNPTAKEIATGLRHAIGLSTMKDMATQVIELQNACNIAAISRYLVTVIDTLRFEGELDNGETQVQGHSLIYMIMDKLASLGAYRQNFDGEFTQHYEAVKALRDG